MGAEGCQPLAIGVPTCEWAQAAGTLRRAFCPTSSLKSPQDREWGRVHQRAQEKQKPHEKVHDSPHIIGVLSFLLSTALAQSKLQAMAAN